MKFQIFYKLNSKSHNVIIDTDSYITAKEIFKELICGELLEIRQFVYQDNTQIKDDGNYFKYITVKLNDTLHKKVYSFKIPKIKKKFNSDLFKLNIFSTFKVLGKVPSFLTMRVQT